MTEDLSKLTKKKLLEEAKKRKLSISSAFKKADIVTALSQAMKAAMAKRKAAAKKKTPAKPAKKATGTTKKVTAKKTATAKSAEATRKVSIKKKGKFSKVSAVKKTAAKRKVVATSATKSSNKTKETARPIKGSPRSARSAWDIRIDGEKFYLADEVADYKEPTPESSGESLPESYGGNFISLLVRDPYRLYLFWDLSSQAIDEARQSFGNSLGELRAVIRLYNVTGKGFIVDENARFVDHSVDISTEGLYVDVENPGSEFIALIGFLDASGKFVSIATSNRVQTPRVTPSENRDEAWNVSDENFTNLYGLSIGASGTFAIKPTFGGSSRGLESNERLAGFENLFSGAVSSFGASEQMVKKREDRDFFFWLDCELIVYGGTTPDATVTLNGETIKLRPDGTFTSTRMHLPDGVFSIPVVATSKDQVETREISPTVTRETVRKESK